MFILTDLPCKVANRPIFFHWNVFSCNFQYKVAYCAKVLCYTVWDILSKIAGVNIMYCVKCDWVCVILGCVFTCRITSSQVICYTNIPLYCSSIYPRGILISRCDVKSYCVIVERVSPNCIECCSRGKRFDGCCGNWDIMWHPT